MRSIGVLCARGASKRLPRKHLRELGGLPLVAWACRAAAASRLSRVVLTTEDEDIGRVAAQNGADAPFRRPAALAADFAEDFDIVADAVDRIEALDGVAFDIVVMIQPTTPFLRAADIDACIARLEQDLALGSCFTARPALEPAEWMFVEDGGGRAERALKQTEFAAHKQLLPKRWLPSGGAYAMRAEAFRAQRRIYCEPLALHPTARERGVDIDEVLDLALAEAAMTEYGIVPESLPSGRDAGFWAQGLKV